MKSNKVKTVLGASVLAAALTAQAQSTSIKLPPSIEPRPPHEFKLPEGSKTVNKEALAKDLSDKLKAMGNSSKTESVSK